MRRYGLSTGLPLNTAAGLSSASQSCVYTTTSASSPFGKGKTRRQFHSALLSKGPPNFPGLLPSTLPDLDGDRYSTVRSGDDPSEIFGLRDYREGDRLSCIHWKLSENRENTCKRIEPAHLHAPAFLLDLNGDSGELDCLLDALASLSAFLAAQELPHRIQYRGSGGMGGADILQGRRPASALERAFCAQAAGSPVSPCWNRARHSLRESPMRCCCAPSCSRRALRAAGCDAQRQAHRPGSTGLSPDSGTECLRRGAAAAGSGETAGISVWIYAVNRGAGPPACERRFLHENKTQSPAPSSGLSWTSPGCWCVPRRFFPISVFTVLLFLGTAGTFGCFLTAFSFPVSLGFLALTALGGAVLFSCSICRKAPSALDPGGTSALVRALALFLSGRILRLAAGHQ